MGILEGGVGGNFEAGFLNVTSLKKHFWGLRHVLLDDPRYRLFGIAETRLDESVDSTLGFKVIVS